MKILTILGLFFLSLSADASVPVTGTFFATRQCPAYISKNHTSNPDHHRVLPQEEYGMVEIDRLLNPDWYRIKIPHARHPLRWVSKRCGQANFYPWVDKPHCNNAPGLADSYVFALSWLPGFCETYGFEAGKAECLALQDDFYAVTHLSLHGLWPNQKKCGTQYGFCGVTPQRRHCDYPAIRLSEAAARELREAMPAYAYGSCLERHEWNKHGSCQLRDSEDYFVLSSHLLREVNESVLGQYLHEHAGQKVSLAALFSTVQESFGDASVNKIFFGCQRGVLVDIWLQLPVKLFKNVSLKRLISQGQDYQRRSNCPEQVFISDFKGVS